MFTGRKIKLRAYKIEDVQRSLDLIEEDGLRDTLSAMAIFPYSFEEEKSFIESSMKPKDIKYNFAIETRENKEYIGSCGINEYDEKNRNVTIGIWLGKLYQGKSYGSDALRILCKFIFEELNMHKIKLHYYDFNEKARICYEAVGFKEEGVHREEIFRHGKYHAIISMGMFKEDLK